MNRLLTLALTIISFFLISSKTFSQGSINRLVIDGYNLLQKGIDKDDKKLLLHAHTILQQSLIEAPYEPFVIYALGYSEYRLCMYGFVKNDTILINQYSDSVIARMKKIKSYARLESDAAALLGVTYGLKISTNFMKATELGPQSDSEIDVAVAADSSNPRAWLSLGLLQFGRPKFAGGSSEKAAGSFARALQCAESMQITDSLSPHWGLTDALIWSGRAAEANNDLKSAILFYHRVLQLSPENAWVKDDLLPEAEKKLAVRSK
jgi:hypothetical protein